MYKTETVENMEWVIQFIKKWVSKNTPFEIETICLRRKVDKEELEKVYKKIARLNINTVYGITGRKKVVE